MEINTFIGLVLALISFSIGSSLQFSDFAKVIRYPKSLTLGLFLQLIFLPLLTLAVVYPLNLSNEIKMGMLILSLCPGGTTSNFISYLFQLETALSVLLTSINSFVILITIPIGMAFFTEIFLQEELVVQIPFWNTVLQVFGFVLVPAFFGILFNRFKPALADKMQTVLKGANLLLLALVFAIKFFADESEGGTGISTAEVFELLPWLLLLHLLATFIAFALSNMLLKNRIIGITIGVEVGLQNTTLALFIAGGFGALSAELSKPALVYALFSFFTIAGFSYFMKRLRKDTP